MRGITASWAALLTLAGATNVAVAASTAWVAGGDTPLGLSGDGRFVSYQGKRMRSAGSAREAP
jgi:hypothetical protein